MALQDIFVSSSKATDRPLITRRAFLQAGVVVPSLAFLGCQEEEHSSVQNHFTSPSVSDNPINLLRVGIIGVGSRGLFFVHDLLAFDNVELRAIADYDQDRIEWAQRLVSNSGKPQPTVYDNGDQDYKRMLADEALDLVIIATPWERHTPMCLEAMSHGAHVASEVPIATTLEECWQLVESAELHNRHCVMLENVNYFQPELAVLNIVRQGLLGEILHGEGAYLHDLREGLLDQDRHNPPFWRLDHALSRNANLYPTHGLGPIANVMNINRGDRFSQITSMSSPSRGLSLATKKKHGVDSKYYNAKFACGDINSSLIKTAQGKTIYLSFSTSTPRPMSRTHLISGTKGTVEGFPDRIFFDGEDHNGPHKWDDFVVYLRKYNHPFWMNFEEKYATRTMLGHNGGDNVMMARLIHSLTKGAPTDMDVYDAVSPVSFPDFTRGKWKKRPVSNYAL